MTLENDKNIGKVNSSDQIPIMPSGSSVEDMMFENFYRATQQYLQNRTEEPEIGKKSILETLKARIRRIHKTE